MIVHIPFKPPLHISHLLTFFFILIILLQMMKMVILLGFFILSFLHTQLNNFTHTQTHTSTTQRIHYKNNSISQTQLTRTYKKKHTFLTCSAAPIGACGRVEEVFGGWAWRGMMSITRVDDRIGRVQIAFTAYLTRWWVLTAMLVQARAWHEPMRKELLLCQFQLSILLDVRKFWGERDRFWIRGIDCMLNLLLPPLIFITGPCFKFICNISEILNCL